MDVEGFAVCSVGYVVFEDDLSVCLALKGDEVVVDAAFCVVAVEGDAYFVVVPGYFGVFGKAAAVVDIVHFWWCGVDNDWYFEWSCLFAAGVDAFDVVVVLAGAADGDLLALGVACSAVAHACVCAVWLFAEVADDAFAGDDAEGESGGAESLRGAAFDA